MLKPMISTTVALAVLATAACGPRGAPAQAPAQKPAAVAAPPSALAAAEPFEALTETAFAATPAQLTAAVAKAEAAAAQVRPTLPAEAQRRLDMNLADMRAAQRADNRADLALASVEAYRTLVLAAAHATVPVAVNLLDYAGFRYQADLLAQPVRWPDMATAAAFARDTWSGLSPQVVDATLRARVDQAVNALATAAARQDPQAADAAARNELDLVDQLEAHFNAPTRAP